MNELARLESQLASVVEDGAVSVSVPVMNPVFSSEVEKPSEVPQLIQNPIRSLDELLVYHVTKSGVKPALSVPVRMSEHVPSDHVVELAGLARKVSREKRTDDLANIHEWTAPYEEPPAVEALAAYAGDLHINPIDPYEFLTQFTAGNHDVAYHQSYRWWNGLLAPFIKWEQALVTPAKTEVESIEDKVIETVTEAEADWDVPVMLPRLSFARVMAGFLGLAMVVSIPAGAVSLSRSLSSSWSEIKDKGSAAVASVASLNFKEAASGLAETDQALNRVNVLAVAISQALPQTRDAYGAARSLVSAGEGATRAASLLEQGIDKALAPDSGHVTERLRVFDAYAEAALPALEQSASAMGEIDTSKIPAELQPKAEEAKALIGDARSALRELRVVNDFLAGVLGEERQRRYLVIFQNPSELRPTGGFMGSMAELTFDRGDLRGIYFPGGGPYDLQSQLKVRVAAPTPLQLVSARWEFQDANWFPDFPAAAKKINWFWSKAGQSTVDGVIAVNARLVERLLAITGPVELPEYGKTITAENFMAETQAQVELHYDKTENKPKEFVGDLMQVLIERLKNPSREQAMKLMALAADSLVSKDIQAWFTDEKEEQLAERFGWNGRILPATGDALAVIGANIAGQKSDLVIDEHVTQDVNIGTDGSIVDTVTMVRKHNGVKGEVFTGANNVQYLRLYVPQGAELLDASGFSPPDKKLFDTPLPQDGQDEDLAAIETRRRIGPSNVDITDEFGRTVFGAWIQLEPGATATTTFKYKLPFTAFDLAKKLAPSSSEAVKRPAYLSGLESQSGKPGRTITVNVHTPDTWTVGWSNRDKVGLDGIWDRDHAIADIFQLP